MLIFKIFAAEEIRKKLNIILAAVLLLFVKEIGKIFSVAVAVFVKIVAAKCDIAVIDNSVRLKSVNTVGEFDIGAVFIDKGDINCVKSVYTPSSVIGNGIISVIDAFNIVNDYFCIFVRHIVRMIAMLILCHNSSAGDFYCRGCNEICLVRIITKNAGIKIIAVRILGVIDIF